MKSRQRWAEGDIFAVREKDGLCSLGQILSCHLPNWVICAFFDLRYAENKLQSSIVLNYGNLISCIVVSPEALDSGRWKVIAHHSILIDRSRWPTGVECYDAGLADDFLNAFYGLEPWDDWYDPNFLDEFLVSPAKKPKHLLFKKDIATRKHTREQSNLEKVHSDLQDNNILLIIELSNDAFGNKSQRSQIYKLQKALKKETERSGLAEFTGNEFGEGTCILYFNATKKSKAASFIESIAKNFLKNETFTLKYRKPRN